MFVYLLTKDILRQYMDIINAVLLITASDSRITARVSNPVFTATEKPGNPVFFQNRKTSFGLPVNPVLG